MNLHRKLSEITGKYLGKLIRFSLTIESDSKVELSILYEDEYMVLYDYIMMLDFELNEVEFIRNQSKSLLKAMILENSKDFEKDILEFMQ